eukprot:SAG22_NODE_9256_length_600_cov_1.345309_1_plen_62_part_01
MAARWYAEGARPPPTAAAGFPAAAAAAAAGPPADGSEYATGVGAQRDFVIGVDRQTWAPRQL